MVSIAFIIHARMISFFIVFLILVYFWFFRIRRLINSYLIILCELIDCKPQQKRRWLPFYSKNEISGVYNGRTVSAGIRYLGRGLEWMPLPYIKIQLKKAVSYNYDRLPYFARIEHGWLALVIDEYFTWGLLDKGYQQFFTKDYLAIMLTRLLAVVEDVERGKTIEEVFR